MCHADKLDDTPSPHKHNGEMIITMKTVIGFEISFAAGLDWPRFFRFHNLIWIVAAVVGSAPTMDQWDLDHPGQHLSRPETTSAVLVATKNI